MAEEQPKLIERTIELTNYCPFNCSYCSTNCLTNETIETGDYHELVFNEVCKRLIEAKDDGVSIIHISGGEPTLCQDFGWMLLEARHHFGRGVVVHSNLIPQIAYNPNVLEGIDVHCYMTPKHVDHVHVLKRIAQGREARAPIARMSELDCERITRGEQPKVHCSANWRGECLKQCDHLVIRADNTVAPGPCKKDHTVPE